MESTSYAKFTPRAVADKSRATIARIKKEQVQNAVAKYNEYIPEWSAAVNKNNNISYAKRLLFAIFGYSVSHESHFDIIFDADENVRVKIINEAARATGIIHGGDPWHHQKFEAKIALQLSIGDGAIEICEKLINLATNTKDTEILLSKEDAAIIFN